MCGLPVSTTKSSIASELGPRLEDHRIYFGQLLVTSKPARYPPKALYQSKLHPARPNYHLRYPKDQLTETIRPLMEVHWGSRILACGISTIKSSAK